MIKAVLISFWALALMGGSIYYFGVMGGASASSGDKEGVRLETFEMQTTSYPIVRDNEIRGYVVLDAVFSIVPQNVSALSVPLEYHIQDGMLETMFADREIDIFQIEKADLGTLKKRIMANINRDRDLVREIRFKSFDYLSKNEIRDMKMRRY